MMDSTSIYIIIGVCFPLLAVAAAGFIWCCCLCKNKNKYSGPSTVRVDDNLQPPVRPTIIVQQKNLYGDPSPFNWLDSVGVVRDTQQQFKPAPIVQNKIIFGDPTRFKSPGRSIDTETANNSYQPQFRPTKSSPIPSPKKEISRKLLLPSIAIQKHISPGCTTRKQARIFSVERAKIYPTESNTVFNVDPTQFVTVKVPGEKLTRIVSTRRVQTWHCKRRVGEKNGDATENWSVADRGLCVAIFQNNGHLLAQESYRTNARNKKSKSRSAQWKTEE